MSTSCRIGIINRDKTIESIYCHGSGYPSYQTEMLSKHYTFEKKIRELIALGDISSLHENINPVGEHSFDIPENGVVVAYHRDREEDWDTVCPFVDKNLDELNRRMCESYLYLYDTSTCCWYMYEHDRLIKFCDITEF